MNYRADVHHDPLGPAAKIEPWPTGIAAYDRTLTSEDRMQNKQKVITKTVQQLRDTGIALMRLAYELDASDARETRPDPSKRKAKKAKR